MCVCVSVCLCMYVVFIFEQESYKNTPAIFPGVKKSRWWPQLLNPFSFLYTAERGRD